MDWINIADRLPEKYQDVIVCTDTGRIKAALHMGNGKFDTYMKVLYWMPMPEAPKIEVTEVIEEPVKKKRGRPKKEGK